MAKRVERGTGKVNPTDYGARLQTLTEPLPGLLPVLAEAEALEQAQREEQRKLPKEVTGPTQPQHWIAITCKTSQPPE
jgi:hypothetical protein